MERDIKLHCWHLCFVPFAKLHVWWWGLGVGEEGRFSRWSTLSIHSTLDRLNLLRLISVVRKAKRTQRRFSKGIQCLLTQTVLFKMPHGKFQDAPRLWDFLGNCCHSLAIRYRRQRHESQGALRALIGLDTGSGGSDPSHSLTLLPPSGLWLRELLLRDHTRKLVPFLWSAQWPLLWPENSCIYCHHLPAEEQPGREGGN